MAYKITNIEGSLSVGNNVAVGGKLTTRGNVVHDGNVRVKGFLECDKIVGVFKGFFATEALLKEAYPKPELGWVAVVGSTIPGEIYDVVDGAWHATGNQGGQLQGDVQMYTQQVQSLQDAITTYQEEAKDAVDKVMTDTMASVPYFDGLYEGDASITAPTTTSDFQVFYHVKQNKFAAYRNGVFFAKWTENGRYSATEAYGENGAPKTGKLYRTEEIGYAWNGTRLEIAALLTSGNLVEDIDRRVYENTDAIAELQKNPAIKLTWDATSNLNEVNKTGLYYIHGTRSNEADNMPITNMGEIVAWLRVANVDSSNSFISQTLELGNMRGADTKVYTRSYNGVEWTEWQSVQGLYEKNLVSDIGALNAYTDNGMYSGMTAYNSSASGISAGAGSAFLLITVNGYGATSLGFPAQVTQMLYLLPRGTESVVEADMYLRTGLWEGESVMWMPWKKIATQEYVVVKVNDAVDIWNESLLNEVTRLQAADTALGNRITNETTNRENAIAGIRTTANQALSTANSSNTIANNAQTKAVAAVSIANDAKTIAETSNENSKDAVSIADAASGVAAEAKEIADTANAKSEEAKVDAENASASAGRAAQSALEAKAEASKVQNKVDRDDNAPELTAGFANNLVGRGEATEEFIGFRPSGGSTSIEDGVAKIEKVKGNTVVYNQLVLNGAFSNGAENWTAVRGTITFNGNTLTFVGNDETNSVKGVNTIIACKLAHKYAILFSAKATTDTQIVICKSMSSGDLWQTVDISKAWESYGMITSDINAENFVLSFRWLKDANQGGSFDLRDVQVTDLTLMFGAGNEPTTIEEFNARKPLNVSNEYNEGELISNNVEAIKSVGFNAWDEEWTQGSFFEGKFYPNQEGSWMTANKVYILNNQTYEIITPYRLYVNIFDAQGTYLGTDAFENGSLRIFSEDVAYIIFRPYDSYATYTGGICIHLVHTGYRNGEYEPYEEFTRSLPISEIKDKDGNTLFPNGLLSAGSAYDEVTERKAIKRIGVRAYTSADDSDASVVTDGKNTHYALAEPIIVDLPEPINLDYEVSDFGTEEAITNKPSAPLRADIVYQFNAVDRIRNNSTEIEALKAQLVALAQQLSALTTQATNNENSNA